MQTDYLYTTKQAIDWQHKIVLIVNSIKVNLTALPVVVF